MLGKGGVIVFLVVLLPSFNQMAYVKSDDKCIENGLAEIADIQLGDLKSTIVNKLGLPTSVLYDADEGSSGQNSGESLFYPGIEFFSADIGGVTYIKTSTEKHDSVYGIKVGMSFKEVTDTLNIDYTNKQRLMVYLCDQPNFLEPHFLFTFATNDGAKLKSIEIALGGEL
ncbi:hypothetical protein ISG33_14550 [Glaciecola sp. MH2013]|uniref:hypothetical protein n=1 Tax=Glaciecola sp. MH2013 TaxID=2785524 RepID=UPI00189CD31F|nr:hypothetical protein [Glaciecola sp. MH2013]MBF7074623.1 hypothetical protein [Glaciecola sp. MH2013]